MRKFSRKPLFLGSKRRTPIIYVLFRVYDTLTGISEKSSFPASGISFLFSDLIPLTGATVKIDLGGRDFGAGKQEGRHVWVSLAVLAVPCDGGGRLLCLAQWTVRPFLSRIGICSTSSTGYDRGGCVTHVVHVPGDLPRSSKIES